MVAPGAPQDGAAGTAQLGAAPQQVAAGAPQVGAQLEQAIGAGAAQVAMGAPQVGAIAQPPQPPQEL